MTLMVRNEEDIISANIDFHLAMGVDHVMVTDNGSEDATVDILREYERKGVLTLHFEPAGYFDQSACVTRMARAAAEQWRASWVINSDADEFWWPLEGNLKATLDAIPIEDQAVVAPRSNFVAVQPAAGMFYQSMTFRETRSLNAVGKPLPPKLCHRGNADVVVGNGNHHVCWGPNNQAPTISPERPIEVLHFPMRSYPQFESKIRLGAPAIERSTTVPKRVGGTWRHLYRLYLEGGLPAYYESQTVGRDQAEAGVLSGQLIRDTRLADWFSNRDAGRNSR